MRWAFRVLHERMGLRGGGVGSVKVTLYYCEAEEQWRGRSPLESKLHVVLALLHFCTNLFAFSVTFLKSQTTAFHSPFIQDAFWNRVFILVFCCHRVYLLLGYPLNIFILANTQIEGDVFLHELCFPAVPNDPLVPTAVLGEDLCPSLSVPAWVPSPCMVECWNSLFYGKRQLCCCRKITLRSVYRFSIQLTLLLEEKLFYILIKKLFLVSANWRINEEIGKWKILKLFSPEHSNWAPVNKHVKLELC